MEAITSSQRRPWPRPAGPVELADAQSVADDDPPWLEFWALLSRWWLTILIVTIVAASATWIFTKYYMQKWYRADAVVTPVAKPLTPGSSPLM
ncbi:MAG TPA: hypothetical protein VMB26_13425, partial [Candidatus Binataceae bacterium]|nr:hypothetical protein [Candidatus Binataceae bacterium]